MSEENKLQLGNVVFGPHESSRSVLRRLESQGAARVTGTAEVAILSDLIKRTRAELSTAFIPCTCSDCDAFGCDGCLSCCREDRELPEVVQAVVSALASSLESEGRLREALERAEIGARRHLNRNGRPHSYCTICTPESEPLKGASAAHKPGCPFSILSAGGQGAEKGEG